MVDELKGVATKSQFFPSLRTLFVLVYFLRRIVTYGVDGCNSRTLLLLSSSLACSPSIPVNLHDARIGRPQAVVFA